MKARTPFLLALAVATGACAPKRIHEPAVLDNGDRVPSSSETVERARADARREQAETSARRDELTARALDGCAPALAT